MKFSLFVPCAKCGNHTLVETTGDQQYPYAQCSACQSVTSVRDDGRISRRAICRADVELSKEDWSLAIILSAMSVECELAFLYINWRMLDSDLIPSEVKPSDTKLWEQELRSIKGGIEGKMDGVSRLLTGGKFCFFLDRRHDLSSTLQQAHPNKGARSWMKFFKEELFYRRNKILHSGQVQFGRSEGEACVKMAKDLLSIIAEANKERYTRFDMESKGNDEPDKQTP